VHAANVNEAITLTRTADLLMLPLVFVTPAEAGIQVKIWMPVFPGMTPGTPTLRFKVFLSLS
jgi:hypothetical protein